MGVLASYELPRLSQRTTKKTAMTNKPINTVSATKNQLQIDHKKAHELTEKILSQMELCARYGDIAYMNSNIFDNKGFILAVESWLQHARDISANLKELNKARGIGVKFNEK